MSDIPGYRITGTIDDRGQTYLASGERTNDGVLVLLKGGAATIDDTGIGVGLAAEFDRLVEAQGEGTPRPLDLVVTPGRTVLVMDDDGSRPLRGRLGSQPSLAEFYRIALGVTHAVEALHHRGVAHLGLTPESILVSDSESARLIDFEHGSSIGRHEQPMVPVKGLAGDLRYLAPEQSGRLLAEVDLRADLYSLGIILYEFLTGVRPFDGLEPLELVHAHLATTPPLATSLRADAPDELAALLDRLLAKSPNQRYRSAAGVVYDLELLARSGGEPFTIGTHDVGDGLQFSDRLYGRDDELGRLLDSFTRADGGRPSLVLVAGRSGSGKSRLVQGMAPLVVERRARWADGKFEELRRDEPYLALAGALGQLVEHALMESDDRVGALREHLERALAGNGALLTRLIPGLTALIGEQPPVPDLPARAADTRFRLAMLSFVEAWARADEPVVLFLDDLQWADPATLELCRSMLSAEGARILVVGAYRPSEVGPGHVLNDLIAAPELVDRTVTIELSELDLESVTAFVSDSLFPAGDGPSDDLGHLAVLLHAKSGGNAFFLRQLISELAATGTLARDAGGRWQWDATEIEEWRPTDNVAELMSQRLQRAIPEAVDTMGWAACRGHEFDLDVLAEASGRPLAQVTADVAAAAHHQFVRVRREQGRDRYRFEHDRIQEAAYSSMPEAERQARHLALGRVLRARAGDDDDAAMMAATDQLGEALALITDPAERRGLVELNHRAGRRALASSSPQIARTYLERAMTLLDASPSDGWSGSGWQAEYESTLAVATDTAKALWLSGATDELIALSDQLAAVARRPLDVVVVSDLLIQHLTNTTQHAQAVEVGRRVLAELGETIPSHPGKLAVGAAMVRMRLRLGRRGPQEIRALPPMTDELARAKMLLLNSMMNPAYFADPDAMAVGIFRMCELSIANGNAPESAFAWNNYGFVLCHILGNYERGHEFGMLAMDMVDEPEARELRSRVQFTFTSMIDHWRTPVRGTYPGYRHAFMSGLEVGDLTYASLARQMEILALLVSGEPLDEVRSAIDEARAWMVQHQQRQTVAMVDLYLQVVDNLQGRGDSVVELAGPVWSAADREAELVAGNDRTALAARDVSELWLAVLADDHDRAQGIASRLAATDAVDALDGTVWVPLYHFLAGLTALWPGRRPRRRTARDHAKQLRKWAKHTPESTSHRVLALEAGLAAGSRGWQRAVDRYEAAATAASESGAFLGELGLICERAALVCQEEGLPTAADAWRRRAGRAYNRWGATIKAPAARRDQEPADQTLDMNALLRLSQAVGSELRLEDLLRQVLTIALEVGGARSGHLITPVDGALVVVASGQHGGQIDVLTRTPIEHVDGLPAAIVNYVARRGEAVILENATDKGPFVLDPDVRARELRSVLCTPLLTQGRLVTIVYLENDLVEGAFKPERLNALSLLSTSASSAIANATLVADLEQLNVAYERFVPADFLRLLGKPNIVDVSLGDGVERDITVLFTDIRDFTTLSESMTPGETFRLVNDYLAMAVPILQQHGGVVDKYIGDAIMGLFPDDPGAAVRAGLHLLGEVDRFNERREALGEPRLETGVGLHTGRLMLGTVGTTKRMDGTVIGDAVNLSSRIEGLTKVYGARLLVTGATWEALDPLERPHARLVDRVRAAGTTRPVDLFHVLTEVEVEARYTLDDFVAGCAAFFDADFETAERRLVEVLRRHPGDTASQRLLARARELSQSGVPPDWDGVTIHTTK